MIFELPTTWVWQWDDGTILREGVDKELVISDSWFALEKYVKDKHGDAGKPVPYNEQGHQQ